MVYLSLAVILLGVVAILQAYSMRQQRLTLRAMHKRLNIFTDRLEIVEDKELFHRAKRRRNEIG